MHGLRTTSVLVLDDCDTDAMKIAKALAQRRIGAILVPGASDERRPRCSLSGIRVAVLDIDLGAGTGSTMQDKIRHTVRTVDRLVHDNNGPYVAVVWTTNIENYTEFKKALNEISCPPVLTVELDKAEILSLSSDKAADAILETIGSAVTDVPPLEFANVWEQIVQDAANDTTVLLALDEVRRDQEPEALDFLAALLKAEADKSALEEDLLSMKALLAALNQVLFDQVEERSARIDPGDATVVEPIRRAAMKEDLELTTSLRSQLNSSLLFDRHAEGFGPGRIYLFDDIKSLGIGTALPDKQDILDDTVENDHIERAANLSVVFLEISAPCDHQQDKVRTSRLLTGVVFAASTFAQGAKKKRVNARRADYLHILDSVLIEDVPGFPSEQVSIAWNAHFPVSVQKKMIDTKRPVGRFREPLLTDVRSWLSYQSGRPGYMSIR